MRILYLYQESYVSKCHEFSWTETRLKLQARIAVIKINAQTYCLFKDRFQTPSK